MAEAKNGRSDPYSEEVIRKKRRFPLPRVIGIGVLLAIQLAAILFAVFYTPKPQDRIDSYEMVIEPREDGMVLLSYRFVWTPLDTAEDLTWVEIGMPNPNFEFLPVSFSSNISRAEKYVEGDYVSARLYLDRPYRAGETLTFSFRVRQWGLLCRDADGYFYELIPGWFNATPVKTYSFIWKGPPTPTAVNTATQKDGYPVWEGEMPCGTYVSMRVQYGENAFSPGTAPTVPYRAFDDTNVTNDLTDRRSGVILQVCVICALILITQLYMIDCVVSYHRGRGFLTGYGHRVHIYGRTNAAYRSEKQKHSARRGGGRSGGGCACACACACAGGGRAGCSQKDTHAIRLKRTTRHAASSAENP